MLKQTTMRSKIPYLLSLILFLVSIVNAQHNIHSFKGILEISDSTQNHVTKQIEMMSLINFLDSTRIHVLFLSEGYDNFYGYPAFEAEIVNKKDYHVLIILEQNDSYREENIKGFYSDSTGYINKEKTEIEFTIGFNGKYLLTYHGTLIDKE
jgi:hypothetical protein